MQKSPAEIIFLTIAITTIFLFIVGAIAIRYIFLYQKKRLRHRQEVADIREAFNHTLLLSRLEIREQTLDHVAKELHATVGHSVSLMQIELEDLVTQAPVALKENTSKMQEIIQQLFSELSAVYGSLNTDHIMHIGFTKSLSNELERLKKTKKFQVTFSEKGSGFHLNSEGQIILFRLCQEVLNNIVKHAQAKSIKVLITSTVDSLTLEIADDGKGFYPQDILEQDNNKVSTGLINIQKRAKLINAVININSSPGAGTIFNIKILAPLNDK